MKDKLIELCDELLYDLPKAELFADYLIANGVTIAEDNNVLCKWVPVSERLPDRTTFVLAYITAVGRSYVGVREYVEDGKNFKMNVGETVTYWMPLPKAPKEVEG